MYSKWATLLNKLITTEMDDEKLVLLVQSREALYNKDHKDYGDSVKKEKCWHVIGKELHQPGLACKNRWFNLRDQYRRAMKLKKLVIGQTGKKKKKWKLEDEMAFIQPFFHERETTSNSVPNDNSETVPGESNRPEDEESTDYEGIVVTEISQLPTEAVAQPDVGSQTRVNSKSEVRISCSPKLQRHQRTPSSKYMPGVMEQVRHIVEAPKSRDPLDSFFSSIAETVRTFPPYYQHMAKSQVFNAVSDIEMEILMKTETSLESSPNK